MLISVRLGRASVLRDPAVFTSLKVLVACEQDATLSGRMDCGRLDADGVHVWVSPDWLRAAGPADAAWRQGLAAMLDFASTKGWLDAEGRVRAHIEFAAAPGATPTAR